MSFKKKSQRKSRKPRTFAFESLQERELLAADVVFNATPTDVEVTRSGRTLTIEGTERNDEVRVTFDTNGTPHIADDEIVVKTESGGQVEEHRFPRMDARFINRIVFEGGAGDDEFRNETSIRSTAYGEDGNDTLIGGSHHDLLYGGDGDDILDGRGGNDRVHGHSGADRITGGPGDDYLAGYSGNDTVRAGFGDDTVSGGSGGDRVYGDQGDDVVNAGSGADFVYGGSGQDILRGGTGDDVIKGDAGNDVIRGGSGDDDLHGNSGNDSLSGDSGNDSVWGDGGNDLVYGGGGTDRVHGNEGNDAVFGGNGFDWVDGGSGDDLISGGYVSFRESGPSEWSSPRDWNNDYLYGDEGADVIVRTDKVSPWGWLDRPSEVTSEDTLRNLGWISTSIWFDLSGYGHST